MKLIYAPNEAILPPGWTQNYELKSITTDINWTYYPGAKIALTPEGDVWYHPFESL